MPIIHAGIVRHLIAAGKQGLKGVLLIIGVVISQWVVFHDDLGSLQATAQQHDARLMTLEKWREASLLQHQQDRAIWLRNECLDMRAAGHPIPVFMARDCADLFDRLNLEYSPNDNPDS